MEKIKSWQQLHIYATHKLAATKKQPSDLLLVLHIHKEWDRDALPLRVPLGTVKN